MVKSPVKVLVPDRVKVPAPVLVILPVEIAIGSLMVLVPTECMVKLYVPVTALPAVGFKVKEEPVPFIVMFSGEVMSLEIDKLAPSATIVAPSADPRALL